MLIHCHRILRFGEVDTVAACGGKNKKTGLVLSNTVRLLPGAEYLMYNILDGHRH